MIAVHPKEDCPHVADHVSADVATNLSVTKPCERCQETTENWICCKCGEIGCSRFQKGHMAQHNILVKHEIAASFSDFSFWCYACESYIKHPSLIPILDAMRDSKFAPEKKETKPKEDKEAGSVTESLANLNLNPQPPATTPSPSPSPSTEDVSKPAPILSSLDIEGIAEYIKAGKAKNIVVMTGAGVSVAAGIPDFRTPGTGLYYNLQKYNLPHPTAVFEIDYFEEKPEAFYMLAKELYPGNFVPTYVHYFIRLLHEKGLLLRNYTQNIDTLERIAKVPADKLVEAHGSFGTSHCISKDCKTEYDSDYVKDAVFSDRIPRCTKCNNLVKPDIVFFGEGLPDRFFKLYQQDFPICDLLIVIGTSLQVQPFASLVKKVTPTTPRLLINMEEVGTTSIMDIIMPAMSRGFAFNLANNTRDAKLLGECQAGVKKLADLLGWRQELEDLYARESKIILENAPKKETTPAPAPAPATTTTTLEFRNDESTTTTDAATPAPAPVSAAQSTSSESTTPAQSTSEPAKPAEAKTEPVQPALPQAETPAQSTTTPQPAPTTPEPAQPTTTQSTQPAQPAQSQAQPTQSTPPS